MSYLIDTNVLSELRRKSPDTGVVNAALLWTISLGRETATVETQLQTAGEQVAVGKEALRQAADALEQSLARERLGTVKPFEVFQSQQFYLEAQTDYLQAVADYDKAQFAMKVAHGEMLVDE
ncbi:MAG: TolC family protein [Gammaproteobacteria bacterium]